MLLKHNPRSFMTGDDPFIRLVPLESGPERTDCELVFEPHHEGFIGIPHGGLAMGLCLDAWRRVGKHSYPINVNFKFGGSGVAIGEPTVFHLEDPSDGTGMVAEITKPGDKRPYLRGDIRPADQDQLTQAVPRPPGADSRELPYYSNCFVCGHHRSVPGLMRRFRVHEQNGSVVTTTPWAMEPEDRERAGLFLIDSEELHPTVLISIFDENTGWSGFMDTGAAGLSVRLEFTLLRPVMRHESLLFMGWPAGIRGNPRAPRFFFAEGAILSMADPGNPQAVAYGRGEWVIMEKFTRQIKENLYPRDDWDWIFPE